MVGSQKVSKMNRLVLFSFYDEDGIADEYVYYLLGELQTIASELVVIINGKITLNDRERFREYSSRIIQRENEGFDAGAYKDIIFNHIGIEQVKKYDELVLCNDTFYGPFVPFKTIWSSFEEKEIDFWGLHFWRAGYLNYMNSFFIVYRKEILLDNKFYEYWDKNIDEKCKDIREVYGTFEVGLFYNLCHLGYRYDSYTDKNACHILKSPDYAIENYNVPIIKKKIFDSEFYHSENVYKVLAYVSKMQIYDCDLIYKNALRKYGWEKDERYLSKGDTLVSDEYSTFPLERAVKHVDDMLAFCHMWDKETIYIYGAGRVAAKIYAVLQNDIKHFGGFIVSAMYDQQTLFGFPIVASEHLLLDDKCIIVGLNPQNSDEVRKKIIETDRVMFLWGEEK